MLLYNHPWFDFKVKRFNLKSNEAVIQVVQVLRRKLLKNCSAVKKPTWSSRSPFKGHERGTNLNSHPHLFPPLGFVYSPHPNPPSLSPILPLSLLLLLHPIIYCTYCLDSSIYDGLTKVFKSLKI